MKVLVEKSEVFYHLLLYAYLSCGHVMCILYKTLTKNILMPPILLCMGGRCIDICILEIFGSEVP